jgi:hypothetical protein
MTKKMISIIKEISLGKGNDDHSIIAVEKRMGFRFPDDYKFFLKHANGAAGPIGLESYIALWPLNELIELNEGYEVQRYAPHLVMFGGTGGGEAFAFHRSDSRHPIIQTSLIGLGTDPLWVISYSFSDFIENFEERLFTPLE